MTRYRCYHVLKLHILVSMLVRHMPVSHTRQRICNNLDTHEFAQQRTCNKHDRQTYVTQHTHTHTHVLVLQHTHPHTRTRFHPAPPPHTSQADLAQRLAQLISQLPAPTARLYFDTFLTTMRREWFAIDYHRLNKFLMLVRKFIVAMLALLRDSGW